VGREIRAHRRFVCARMLGMLNGTARGTGNATLTAWASANSR
jgi:hypothetical protein